MPIPEDVISNLKKKYINVHPFVFHRSVERAKTAGELYDILEAIPEGYPIVWNGITRRWVTTEDFYQSKGFL